MEIQKKSVRGYDKHDPVIELIGNFSDDERFWKDIKTFIREKFNWSNFMNVRRFMGFYIAVSFLILGGHCCPLKMWTVNKS